MADIVEVVAAAPAPSAAAAPKPLIAKFEPDTDVEDSKGTKSSKARRMEAVDRRDLTEKSGKLLGKSAKAKSANTNKGTEETPEVEVAETTIETVQKKHCWVTVCPDMGAESGVRKRMEMSRFLAAEEPPAAKGPLPPAKGPLPPATTTDEPPAASAPSSSSTQDAAAATTQTDKENRKDTGDMFDEEEDY